MRKKTNNKKEKKVTLKPRKEQNEWSVEKCLRKSIVCFVFGMFLLFLSFKIERIEGSGYFYMLLSIISSGTVAYAIVKYPFIKDETKYKIVVNYRSYLSFGFIITSLILIKVLLSLKFNLLLYSIGLLVSLAILYAGLNWLVSWTIDLFKAMYEYFKSKNLNSDRLSKYFNFLLAIIGIISGIVSLIINSRVLFK